MAAPPAAPLAAEVLTRPAQFGAAVAQSGISAWHYWPAPALAALLSGLCYALLLRPALGVAAESVQGTPPPLLLTHIGNAFGSVFLTALSFAALWGFSRLVAGQSGRGLPLAQVWSATFTLPILLALPVLLLTLLTPAAALDPAQVAAAQGQWLALQRVALRAAAQTPAALLLVAVTLLTPAAQCFLAYRALRPLSPQAGLVAGLPLLPALGLGLLGLLPLLLLR